MDKLVYEKIENYMLDCMGGGTHDEEHVYRVLYTALDITKYEMNVNMDILVAASLLHDIGRKEQDINPNLCHAEIGSIVAFNWLIKNNVLIEYAEIIRDCILTHRFRNNNSPKSLEAKILFDSDKIDSMGAIGIARNLMYKGRIGQPIYSLDKNGDVLDGKTDQIPSFFQEYRFKNEKIYSRLYTKRGKEIAKKRKIISKEFFDNLFVEVTENHNIGKKFLERYYNN